MSNELRVTVVATGIGDTRPDISLVPTAKVSLNERSASRFSSVDASVQANSSAAYEMEERTAAPAPVSIDDSSAATNLDYLDIPAFLRKQAD